MQSPRILFAHAAYRLAEACARAAPHLAIREVRDAQSMLASVGDTEILVISGLWRDAVLDVAPNLRFVQSISAGTDQFPKAAFAKRGIRLASAQGANERAVAEHALALLLALFRRIPEARDNQARRHWRPMIGDPAARERELAGKTLLIVGYGRIGRRVARLASAFDMRVLATRRNLSAASGDDGVELHSNASLHALLPQADSVVLTCPLTPDTERLIDGAVLARMKPSAVLINVSRGRVVDKPALVAALSAGRLAAAALDVTVEEPLPAASPLWAMPNVLITPHTAGETEAYEENVVALLLDNLQRLARGEALVNGIV
jgi:phosphoglycerate dehydrogenase-like enzyme